MRPQKATPTFVAVGLAAIVLAAIILWFSFSRPQSDDNLSTDQARQLLSEKNIALGYLESDQPEKSVETWTSIAQLVPHEPIGPRNLLVANLLSQEKLAANQESQFVHGASEALKQLQVVEPDSPVTLILAARVANTQGDLSAALEYWHQAAAKSPNDPAIFFEAYLAAKAEGAQATAEAQDDLQKSSTLAPNNSAVLLEQLSLLATQKNPQLVDVLTRAEQVLAPLEETVQRLVRVSLQDLITKAREAANEENWPLAQRNVQMIMNVTRAEESVQSDRLIVDRSPLEFVIPDFSSDFYADHDLQVDASIPAIDVTFAEQPLIQLPDSTKVVDVATVDFDLDNALDLAVLTDDSLRIFTKESGKLEFTESDRIDLNGEFHHLLVADLDGDASIADGEVRHSGDFDFIVYGPSGILVIENSSIDDQRLKIVEQEQAANEVHSAALGDLDHDGDLDVFLSSPAGISIWSNVDGLHFRPWSETAITGLPKGAAVVQAVPVDWDRDIDLDILVAMEGEPRFGVLENLRHRRMRWRPLTDQFPELDEAQNFYVLDADANASWDILFQTKQGAKLARTRTPEPGKVIPLNTSRVADSTSSNWLLFDFDNDGWDDLLTLGEDSAQLLRRESTHKFSPKTTALADLRAGTVSAIQADIDVDGDLDVIFAYPNSISLLVNEGGNMNHWIDVKLLAAQVKGGAASPSGRVNQYGVGSLLELRNAEGYQPRVVRDGITHIGLGNRDSADVIRVIWTNGIPQSIINPDSDTLVTERQTLKGSCPYLYAWSGERFEFVTDLLWASPIGLQTAEGKIAPDRPWEYLKIPGHLVAETDGQYLLRITEELWEAAYFDEVKLIAVDHPEGTDIYTNEKVGPPSIAEPKIHVVMQPIWPTIALDSKGRDILEQLAEQDDRYVRAFEKKLMQGYTEDHFIELDFGDLSGADQITLFLTGWIYPTDTSINVGLAENDAIPAPRPPYLQTLDNDGNWVETIPFTGFPGGKTKTIAIDISDAFAGDSYRLRVGTSSEIYWDAAFVTVGTHEVELKQTSVQLTSAELRYRGFSEPVIHDQFGPESYDYAKVSKSPKWPSMQGNFTRYGDVLPLLEKTDSHLVTIGAGDEIVLKFQAPAEKPAPGWRRDFVLHNVGWDKDADLNTLYGNTAEPLPFQKMEGYPSIESPDDPAYLEYLESYQTRKQRDASFQNALRSSVSP